MFARKKSMCCLHCISVCAKEGGYPCYLQPTKPYYICASHVEQRYIQKHHSIVISYYFVPLMLSTFPKLLSLTLTPPISEVICHVLAEDS